MSWMHHGEFLYPLADEHEHGNRKQMDQSWGRESPSSTEGV